MCMLISIKLKYCKLSFIESTEYVVICGGTLCLKYFTSHTNEISSSICYLKTLWYFHRVKYCN